MFNAALGSNGTSGNGDPMQVGLGTQIGAITQNFGQGSFQSTGTVTDMAISGEGLFMLRRSDGSQVYSRAGNFSLDNDGYLVSPSGCQVLGWNRTGTTLTTNGVVVPIQINSGTVSPPTATTTVATTTNLDADAAIGDTFSTPMQVYDSLGAEHTILATYTKTAADTWSIAYSSDTGTTVTGPAAVTFDSSGNLLTPATDQTISVTGWPNGAANSTINWDIWDGTTATLTGYASSSATTSTTQDGAAAGTISSITVDTDGIITGNFTNGQTIQLAEVALATFANLNGLSKEGNNTWSQTLASGSPNIGAADEGGRGTILGGQLELSNVDTASEFTALIVAQRGYQANSRVVTTTDTLLQEVLNMVR